jgi:hypothetical protein
MRDVNSNILPRRQAVERRALAPVLAMVQPDAQTEPAFSERLCLVIKQYWRLRGVEVRAWVEYQRANGRGLHLQGRARGRVAIGV